MPDAYIAQYRLNGELHMELVWDDAERDDREHVPLYRNPLNRHILERAVLAIEEIALAVHAAPDRAGQLRWIAADLRRELAKLTPNAGLRRPRDEA